MGSPIRLSRGAADGGQTLPVKISGGIGPSESQLASINPLSGISLVSLSQTVERPLFNRTRAPKPKPEPQVVEQAVEPEAGPEDFTLLGIVVANDDKTVRCDPSRNRYRFRIGWLRYKAPVNPGRLRADRTGGQHRHWPRRILENERRTSVADYVFSSSHCP